MIMMRTRKIEIVKKSDWILILIDCLFCSDVREIEWALEVAQLLLDAGEITTSHVAFEAFAATMGTFAGAWEHHHVPWHPRSGTFSCGPHFPVWSSFCKALRNHGTRRQHRLLQGFPKSAGLPNSKVNFVCPSDSTQERDKEILDFAEGPKQDRIDVFRTVLSSWHGECSLS
jgi:hypothetical protein